MSAEQRVDLSSIEMHYPRIAEELQRNWGGLRIKKYLDEFIMDERGNRAGFPYSVWEELIFLQKLNNTLFDIPPPVQDEYPFTFR